MTEAEGEAGGCSESESNDSSTVESEPCPVDMEELNTLLLELLVLNPVSKD